MPIHSIITRRGQRPRLVGARTRAQASKLTTGDRAIPAQLTASGATEGLEGVPALQGVEDVRCGEVGRY